MEFALVMLPLTYLVFGIIQYGLYFYSAQTGSNTAHAALRQLAVGNCQSDAALKTYVDAQLSGAKAGTVSITRTYTNPDGTEPASPAPQNVAIGGMVKLTIVFPTANLHFPFLPFMDDPKVTRIVDARVEDTTDQGCGA